MQLLVPAGWKTAEGNDSNISVGWKRVEENDEKEVIDEGDGVEVEDSNRKGRSKDDVEDGCDDKNVGKAVIEEREEEDLKSTTGLAIMKGGGVVQRQKEGQG